MSGSGCHAKDWMALGLHDAVDGSAEVRIEFDRLLPIEGCHAGLDLGDGKRALLCGVKEAAGGKAQSKG